MTGDVIAGSAPAASSRCFDAAEARAMIGRQLRLRQGLLGYPPGTPCRVQCVVDFGEGPQLWVTAADERAGDVYQVGADDLSRYFTLMDAAPETAAVTSALAGRVHGASHGRSRRSLARRLWQGVTGFPAAVAATLRAGRLVEQPRRAGLAPADGEALAAEVRERLQGRG